MAKFRYGKLIRDKILPRQLASGAKPTHRRLKPDEHKQELVRKIAEEAQEIAQAEPAKVASEIADVQQALDDLKTLYNLTDTDIAKAQAAKKAKDGTFQQGIYVEDIELDDSDPWVTYYRQNPDRYPEIVD